MSQLKNPGIAGICVDTWNGYTEGYAMVPSCPHGSTPYSWLRDLLEPDPRHFSHVHYVDHVATHRVYGAICEKWIKLGADRAFGAPISDELSSGPGRKQEFAAGKAIYWGPETGAWELHGLIGKAYRDDGAAQSRLGFPLSDEEPFGVGRINYFQFGTITWMPGAAAAERSTTLLDMSPFRRAVMTAGLSQDAYGPGSTFALRARLAEYNGSSNLMGQDTIFVP